MAFSTRCTQTCRTRHSSAASQFTRRSPSSSRRCSGSYVQESSRHPGPWISGTLPAGRVALFLSFLADEVERRGLVLVVIGSDDQQTGAFVALLLLKGAER